MSGTPPRRRRRIAAPLLAASAVLAISGCGIVIGLIRADPPDPTPRTIPAEVLARAAEACGTTETAPLGDVSFEAVAAPAQDAPPSGMTLPLEITVQLDSGHGDHSAGPGGARGVVTGPDGVVVGLVTAVQVTDEGRPRGGELTGEVTVTLGACAGDEAALGDPLPEGDYELVPHGTVSPLDHNHGQQEYWIAPAVGFSVAGEGITA